ncbi:tetratricopeptide repeat protein [Roseicella aerolata]|uniref:protein O-GlcNAc transferase n=1 Tax=Roseicella aerolata TaxID=2883479 RepID=A0A9X1IGV7_9PROT|nr:tetratricopeptide repeat protein [Roseicella aerolata]MCB4822830.1 tetratricopeptide repeat protein [Roseicella aerolata]
MVVAARPDPALPSHGGPDPNVAAAQLPRGDRTSAIEPGAPPPGGPRWRSSGAGGGAPEAAEDTGEAGRHGSHAAGPWRAGLRALAEGSPAAAVPLLREAVARGDGGGLAALNLGLALMQLGRLAEAVPALEDAARDLPDHAEPPFRLGNIAGLRGEAGRAEALFRAALLRDPQHVPALAALAALEEAAGRLDAAADGIARARAIDPDEPELDFAAARLAWRRDDLAGAIAAAEAVLARRPAHAGAARLLAELLLRREGPEAALAAVAARAVTDPAAAGWAFAAATLHAAAGRREAALAELHLAAALAPEEGEIQAALGCALADAGRGQEAEPLLRAAIPVRPTDLDLRNRLATVLWKQHRLAAMLEVLEEAIADFGPQPVLLMNQALALNAMGEQEAALTAVEAAVAHPAGGAPALMTRMAVLPYHPERGHAAALLAAGRAVAAALGPAAPPPPRPRDPGRRLRIGLLSGGLGQHPVGWLTLAGLEALPEAEFELAAYCLKPRQDPMAARFRARVALWRDAEHLDVATLAGLMMADGLDILLDLGGYGDGGRPGLLQRRPAPVQIKWVGMQNATMGLDGLDGMLTDRWETPPGFERFYTERLLHLPDGYVCYAPPPGAPPVAPLPALGRGHVTFGCFNNLAKVTPPVLRAWGRILAALPEARLVLRTHALGEAAMRQRLRARLTAHGLPEDRVALEGGVPHRALLDAYGGIDIALDPFPYAGGLTVCEALWMGVPVVALAGDSFCARHALSHLSNVGLPDWVAESEEAYVALAIARAGDLPALATLRAGLRARVAASPLTDAARFGRALAATLRDAWRRWCATATSL